MKHAIAELRSSNFIKIQRVPEVDEAQVFKDILVDVATRAGATVLGSICHKFEPQGATAIVMIGESHLSLHTYPEFNYVSLDVYTCGGTVDPLWCVAEIAKNLEAESVSVLVVSRGNEKGFYLEKEELVL